MASSDLQPLMYVPHYKGYLQPDYEAEYSSLQRCPHRLHCLPQWSHRRIPLHWMQANSFFIIEPLLVAALRLSPPGFTAWKKHQSHECTYALMSWCPVHVFILLAKKKQGSIWLLPAPLSIIIISRPKKPFNYHGVINVFQNIITAFQNVIISLSFKFGFQLYRI